MVKIDYEELKPVCSIQEAMAEDAPRVHEKGNLCQSRHVTRGDAKKALENSRYVVTQTYRTPFTEHAFLEPECAVAFPYKDGVKVYSTDQGVYDTMPCQRSLVFLRLCISLDSPVYIDDKVIALPLCRFNLITIHQNTSCNQQNFYP